MGQGCGTEHPGFAVLCGAHINVVDLKLFKAAQWLASGNVEHIPASIFAGYPKLTGVYEAVRDHPGVKAWYPES